ncbi:ABC transporter permease [Streptomyces sp. DSM 44915]|uniref:ABC transporter permease n=1 Tax=Streptomyces chisholmiae TaxID=3075540 RepID=A0ABU2JMS5_9ACTN|nr:ABC transporter permease [Streptomyces sp. DSM 44915]MDT0266004.1 ABC transporter permease [Streptomyces sp. DSM 44915]
MSTATRTAPQGDPGARAAAPRPGLRARLRPHGMVWLVWRQHRAGLWTVLALAAATTGALLWVRGDLADTLAANPLVAGEDFDMALVPHVDRIDLVGLALTFVPLLIGVFLGAPLFAGDLESGTAKLVGVQSSSSRRWLLTKLGTAAAVACLGAVAVGLAFRGWWDLISAWGIGPTFETTQVFDSTGPVLVAMTLLALLIGATVGLYLRRTLPAMVVTLGILVALKIAWEPFRLAFGSTTTVTTSDGTASGPPRPPDGAVHLDTFRLAADGGSHDGESCVPPGQVEPDDAWCEESQEIVGWSVEYLPLSQLAPMQWLSAAALGAVALGVGVLLRHAARRALR